MCAGGSDVQEDFSVQGDSADDSFCDQCGRERVPAGRGDHHVHQHPWSTGGPGSARAGCSAVRQDRA